jgi:hypothetical protein
MDSQLTTKKVQVTLSNTLYQYLAEEAQRSMQDVATVIQDILERHARQFDMTKTRTWALCGTLEVAEPEAPYLDNTDEGHSLTTNYAEHVDDVLYRG